MKEIRKTIVVNDKMQRNYRYELTVPYGEGKDGSAPLIPEGGSSGIAGIIWVAGLPKRTTARSNDGLLSRATLSS